VGRVGTRAAPSPAWGTRVQRGGERRELAWKGRVAPSSMSSSDPQTQEPHALSTALSTAQLSSRPHTQPPSQTRADPAETAHVRNETALLGYRVAAGLGREEGGRTLFFSFWVQGPGIRAQGSGFKVQGLGLMMLGARLFGVQGSGSRVKGSRFRVKGLGLRVYLAVFEVDPAPGLVAFLREQEHALGPMLQERPPQVRRSRHTQTSCASKA
jgi:hypothetical protein